MEYRFVNEGEDGRKRKAPYSACDQCKKRKKRCPHIADTSDGRTTDSEGRDTKKTSNTKHETPFRSHSYSESRTSRFVGELAPEAVIDHEHDTSSRRPDRHQVGTWVEYDRHEDVDVSDTGDDRQYVPLPSGKRRRIAEESWLLPPVENQRALVSIFQKRVQTILPVLDETMEMPAMLIQAVCLVASKDERARDHLRIGDQTLDVNEFARRLYTDADHKVRSLHPSQVDRMHLIETLTLLSLHIEGQNGVEESSMHLCQAIHHGQSIGLHLNQSSSESGARGHRPRKQTADGLSVSLGNSSEHRVRMFWIIWSLDRIYAAIYGRPRLLVNDDSGLDFGESLSLFSPGARLWMQISEMLDRVIDLYSPHATVDREKNLELFPTFEELLVGIEHGRDRPSQNAISSLEFYYHAVSMISCRLRLQAGKSKASLFTLRRSLSAAAIGSMLKHVDVSELAPLSVIPYSISLALLVAYQQFRQSRRKVAQAIAREQLELYQKKLEEMGRAWWPAKNMARIGKSVLEQLSRADQPAPPTARGTTETIQSKVDHGQNSLASDVGKASRSTEPPQAYHDPLGQNPNLAAFAFDENAFADMDAVFGNLMDMNQFPENFDFAFEDGNEGGSLMI
ncbi:hypothetical protein MBLNU457_3869t1 [Dothideomycetes sp. NU457]